MKDDSPFVFAGLWEGWKDPTNGEWLHTCTIITGEPKGICTGNSNPYSCHDCQTVITILGHLVSRKRILVPFPADEMEAWPISSRVK
jgi:SOS response associated peptidase (SRAP)